MTFTIETERLVLRTMDLEDIDAIYQIWGNAQVMKHCGGPSTRDRIKRSIQYYERLQNERGYSTYTVLLKDLSTIVGVCGFNPNEKEDEAELIFHFAQSEWGKGYATEAAAASVKYLMENKRDLKKIIAAVDPHNNTSSKVLLKIGLCHKGTKWFEDTQQEENYFELEIK